MLMTNIKKLIIVLILMLVRRKKKLLEEEGLKGDALLEDFTFIVWHLNVRGWKTKATEVNARVRLAAVKPALVLLNETFLDESAIEKDRNPAKQKIFDEISAQITAARREEEEFLDLQITLANQEAEEKRVLADKEAAEKRIKSRLEMMEANEYQKKLKAAQRQQEAEERG